MIKEKIIEKEANKNSINSESPLELYENVMILYKCLRFHALTEKGIVTRIAKKLNLHNPKYKNNKQSYNLFLVRSMINSFNKADVEIAYDAIVTAMEDYRDGTNIFSINQLDLFEYALEYVGIALSISDYYYGYLATDLGFEFVKDMTYYICYGYFIKNELPNEIKGK